VAAGGQITKTTTYHEGPRERRSRGHDGRCYCLPFRRRSKTWISVIFLLSVMILAGSPFSEMLVNILFVRPLSTGSPASTFLASRPFLTRLARLVLGRCVSSRLAPVTMISDATPLTAEGLSMRGLYLAACAVLLLCAAALPAEDWPAWRGRKGDGHSSDKAPPLKWGRNENVRWKTPLPGPGNSSPIVCKDRVFVTQALEKGRRRALLCFARGDGKLLWQREVLYTGKESTHETNPYCSASPVTDGVRVIASLGSAGMVCYDYSGKELWRKDLGKLEHVWGNASSPILYGDLAILWCGPGERQFLLAVKKINGETVWKHDEPGGKSGAAGPREWLGSWCTPIIARVGGHDELILGVPRKVKAFDPKTGAELWSCRGLGDLVYASPVCSADGIVVAVSGYYGPALAVRAGGKGDVTETRRLWHHTQRHPQRIGSPVIVGEHAYLLNESGVAQCFDLKTGEDLWKKERAGGTSWSSLVYAADRLYVNTTNGDTLVLSASPKYKLLARNSLGEGMRSSIAVAGDELFIRTYEHLWCIGAGK
jgi:outer membrane protein assembly factor BamB